MMSDRAFPGFTFAAALLSVGVLLGCGDDDAPDDAAVDATADARVDAGVDAGPPCERECAGGDRCCVVAGEEVCVDVMSDLAHCGGCGIACRADQGNECRAGRCACGTTDIGCLGEIASICCPPTEERTMPYCANLQTSGEDCGACGNPCDGRVGTGCSAGVCVCGESREGCEGTETSTCCSNLGGSDASCVDVTSNREHCSACGRRCRAGEDCVDSVCRLRPGLDAGVDAGTDAGVDAGEEEGGD